MSCVSAGASSVVSRRCGATQRQTRVRCTAVRQRVLAASGAPVQLGTAELPARCNVDAFNSALFQWAATLTTSGSNLPFVLSQRVDRTPTGFKARSFMPTNCSS